MNYVNQELETIKMIFINHEHLRGSSSNRLPSELKSYLHDRNNITFLKKWSNYLSTRNLNNSILFDLRSIGWGDVICCIPSVLQSIEDNPQSKIVIYLSTSILFNIFNNIEGIIILIQETDFKVEKTLFDQIHSLDQIDFASPINLSLNIAETFAYQFNKEKSFKFFKKFIQSTNFPNQKYCVFHINYDRAKWQGRGVPHYFYLPLIQIMKSNGYIIVSIGGPILETQRNESIWSEFHFIANGKLSIEETMSYIGNSELFIGMDSGPLHLAQFLNIPTFAIFGATIPSSRLMNLHNSYGYIHPDLNCIGCYHRLNKPNMMNYCIRLDEACTKKIPTENLVEEFQYFLKNKWDVRNLIKLIHLEQSIISSKLDSYKYMVDRSYQVQISELKEHIINLNRIVIFERKNFFYKYIIKFYLFLRKKYLNEVI